MGISFGKAHAASEAEMEGFAHAAEYLEKVGFDVIQLHGARGYIISQFLLRRTNKRTDEYRTRTVENRLRIATDIARAIRKRRRISRRKRVSRRGSRSLRPTRKEGFDFVELSGGNYENFGLKWEKEPTKVREAFFLKWAKIISDGLADDDKLKLYLVGGLRAVQSIVEALSIVDRVSFATLAAAEPDLLLKMPHHDVSGTIKPIEGYDRIGSNFVIGLARTKAQLAQIALGYEPVDFSDEAAIRQFAENIDKWWENVIADGHKLEYIRAPTYSHPLSLYKPKA